ncbi:MAG: hypothetical protein ACLSS9_09505, partial [Acutalibacteraceae bacterium]
IFTLTGQKAKKAGAGGIFPPAPALLGKRKGCKIVFARLFQKAVNSKGNVFGRVPEDAKNLRNRGAGRAKNIPVGCFSAGNPRRGFPDAVQAAYAYRCALSQEHCLQLIHRYALLFRFFQFSSRNRPRTGGS